MKIVEVVISELNKATIRTDEDVSIILTVDTLVEYGLFEGREVTDEELTEIIYYDMTQKAKELAFKFVSRRLRSQKEIEDYLRNKGYDEIVRGNVIEVLKRYDYINDEEYARAYMNDKMNINKLGKDRIRYELRYKGIDDEIINRVILANSNLEIENAVELLRKSLPESPSYKEKGKAYRKLASKGYSPSVIDRAFYIVEYE